VQQAWIDEQVPQCGFCQNGMMITATALLEQTPAPTVEQIKAAYMSGSSPHLCRCGTYSAIVEAVQKASTLMAKAR
jgi:isoquinoline 1-oxidoreductase alpha subunit